MRDEHDSGLIDIFALPAACSSQADSRLLMFPILGLEGLMTRRIPRLAFVSLVLWQFGCGGGAASRTLNSGTPGTPSANISVSPGSATVGSPDLALTVASKTFTFLDTSHKFTQVLWSQAGVDTPLATTFVSGSQVTAILPASFMLSALAGTVRVELWDKQGDAPLATSSSVPFQVTSTPTTPTPSISSISPSTIAAGSSDVTIRIDGLDFGHFGHFVSSTAFWTTNGNLHDTGTWLQTAIVGDNQLTAVIPKKLLQSPTSVQIVVMNGDVMGMSDGYFGYPRSNSVTFTVTP